MVNLKELELTDAFVELVRRAATELPAEGKHIFSPAFSVASQTMDEKKRFRTQSRLQVTDLGAQIELELDATVGDMYSGPCSVGSAPSRHAHCGSGAGWSESARDRARPITSRTSIRASWASERRAATSSKTGCG